MAYHHVTNHPVPATIDERPVSGQPFTCDSISEFATVTKVDKNVSNIVYATDQPEVLSRISDTGLNFGLGAGFLAGRSSLVFTCRLMFLWGREVDYVVRHSVVIDSSGHVNYTKGSTTTSLLMLQIGIQLVE